MSSYGNFNLNKNRKGKRAGVIIGIIAAVIVVGICYIGITIGSGSEGMEHISSAVAENVQLKQQISELNDQIAKLNEEIALLTAELGTRPTVAPTPYEAVIIPTEAPQELISPRGNLR